MAASKQGKLNDNSLFYTLAHDLKTPLVRIAYMAEADQANATTDIHAAARHAIDMLDAYTLSITSNQTSLALQPISPSAVVADTAYNLTKHAQQFMCNVRVVAPKKHAVILAHRQVVTTALTMMGRAFIESQQQDTTSTKKVVTLAAYATKNGIALGVFAQSPQKISYQFVSQAKANIGKALRPFVGMAGGTASQLFIADQLATSMHTTIRSAKRGHLQGLAFDLQLTNQLTLV